MRNHSRRRALVALAAALAWHASPGAAGETASPFPARPIRLVVPFVPGGTTDIVGRLIGKELQQALGVPVVIENLGGAGGNIGADVVAKAKPDGHTLVVGTAGTHGINALLYPKMPYDPIRDFVPVVRLIDVANVLVAHPSAGVATVRELVELARKKPLMYATAGNGTTLHLSGELFRLKTGIAFTHVPYKGSGAALNDVLGGQVPFMFDNTPSVSAHIASGALRAIAVTSKRRVASLPGVPTLHESGVTDYEATGWFGVFAPAGTSQEIVGKLNGTIVRILHNPAIREQLEKLGAEPVGDTPAEFAAFQKAELVRWSRIVKDADIRL